MSRQIIISLSREYASGGRQIARLLAEKLGINYYDRDILAEIARDKGVDTASLEKYDEVPRGIFGNRTIRGYSSSPHVNVAEMQFEFIAEKAESGESFLIVGRCSEAVLAENPNAIKLFILADTQSKIARISEKHGFSADEALVLIKNQNRLRKSYHNYYTELVWGDSRNYDICINTSKLGIEKTADYLYEYIKRRIDDN